MLEAAKYMLQFDIALEEVAQPDAKDEDSERESLGFEEIRRLQGVSLGSRKKSTYWAVDSETPFRTLDWKAIAMTSFDFEDNPFRRIREEID